eukprot:scaffold106435_cov72-Phaeocystis_antarctica.AAC.3
MLSANVPHTAYLTPGFSVSDWIASTRKPRTALDGNGATSCAAEGALAGWRACGRFLPRATHQAREEHLDEEREEEDDPARLHDHSRRSAMNAQPPLPYTQRQLHQISLGALVAPQPRALYLQAAFERGVLERAQLHVGTPHIHTPRLVGDECDARRDAGLSGQQQSADRGNERRVRGFLVGNVATEDEAEARRIRRGGMRAGQVCAVAPVHGAHGRLVREVRGVGGSVPPMSKTSWLSLRPAGSPEASFSARACLRLPGASGSLGQSVGWAALAGQIGLVFDTAFRQSMSIRIGLVPAITSTSPSPPYDCGCRAARAMFLSDSVHFAPSAAAYSPTAPVPAPSSRVEGPAASRSR